MRAVRVLTLAATVTLVGALAVGCGGSGEDDAAPDGPSEVAEPDVVGVFDVRFEVVETEISEQEAVGDTAEVEAFLTCADRACSEVHQRTTARPGSRYGSTVLLASEGDDWVGTKRNSVACADGSESVDEHAWRWTPDPDGGFALEIDQEFVACDGSTLTARTEGVATEVDGGEAPYAEGDVADDLKRIVSEWDADLAGVYEEFNSCAVAMDETGDVACVAPLAVTWTALMDGLEPALEVDLPTGHCEDAAAAVDLTPPREAMQSAQASVANGARTSEEVLKASVDTMGDLQTEVVKMLQMCVAPDDLADLGDGERLTVDVQAAVFPAPAPTAGTTTTEG